MNAVTSYTTADNSRLRSGQAWTVWALVVAFVFYLFSFQAGYSIVNLSVNRDLGLTAAQVGVLAATYTWSFVIFQLIGGVLLDLLGARKVVPAGIAFVTVGVFSFSQASSVSGIVGAQFILALGACVGFVAAGYVGGKWFGMAKFGLMLGMVQCLASMFAVFGEDVIGLALQGLDWRGLFYWVAVAGVALFVLCVMFVRDPAPTKTAELQGSIGHFVRRVLVAVTEVATVGGVWSAALYGALVFSALLACGIVWAPKLMLLKGFSQDAAELSASMLWLGLAFGCLVIPWWSEAIKRRKVPAISAIALQACALAVLIYGRELTLIGSMLLWFVFGTGAAAHILSFCTAGDIVRPKQIGTAVAIVNGIVILVSGLALARFGDAAGGTDESRALAPAISADVLLIGLLVALLLAIVMRESHPKSGGALISGGMS